MKYIANQFYRVYGSERAGERDRRQGCAESASHGRGGQPKFRSTHGR